MKLFHLSAQPLGSSIILSPRIPRDRAPFEDRHIARICVAPTISGCLLALRGCFYNRGRWWIYALSDEQIVVEPHRVPDAKLTGELWLLNTAKFDYENRISAAL